MAADRSDEVRTLRTSDGLALRAELWTQDDPVATAAICHPHPLYGGDMYNNVVSALFEHLGGAGVACVRFNFRGSGGSEGQHDSGGGERLDVTAAIDELNHRWPDRPLLMAGYSFGADVSLAVDDDRISGWLAVAPPLRVVPIDEMVAGTDPRPKRIVTGSADDFRPPDQARAATDHWTNCEITVADGANHFFAVGLDAVRAAATDLVRQLTDR